MAVTMALECSRLLAVGRTSTHAEDFQRRISEEIGCGGFDACSHKDIIDSKCDFGSVNYSLVLVEVDKRAKSSECILVVDLLREYSETMLIVVVGQGAEKTSKIKYYLAGADHYFRAADKGAEGGRELCGFIGDLYIDPLQLDAARMRIIGKRAGMDVSFFEMELLKAFLGSRNHVLSHDEVAMAMGLNVHFYDQRTMEKSISRLRGKMKDILNVNAIQSVRGYGYRLARGIVSLIL